MQRSHKTDSSNPKQDRAQAARDINELRKLEREVNERRAELQHNFKATTGARLVYRETAKLNSKATVGQVLLNKRNQSLS